MNLNELKEQLQENLVSYLETVVACEFHDSYLYDGVIDTACQIVVDTFNDSFYAGAPTLDTTPKN